MSTQEANETVSETAERLPDCQRCSRPCVQSAFEVLPGLWVCFNCATDDELTGSFEW